MIAKDLIIAKDKCSYTIRILRQDKSLRDNGDGPVWGAGYLRPLFARY